MFYDRKRLFDLIRTKLTTSGKLNQSQVDGIEILLEEGEKRNFNTEWIAYVLATAWHETGGTMEPVRETFADTDEQAIARLEKAYKAGKLKGVKTPYWRTGFFGRGYVQLTHEYNYRKMGEWLGIDLVKDPSKALDPRVAAQIIYEGMLKGMFTGKKLPDFLDGIDGTDAEDVIEFEKARAIVNGVDQKKKIAGYALKFEQALRASEGAVPVIKPTDKKAEVEKKEEEVEVMGEAPQNQPKPGIASTTIWATIASLITSLIGILANLNPIIQGLLILLIAGFAFWIIRNRLKPGGKDIDGIF